MWNVEGGVVTRSRPLGARLVGAPRYAASVQLRPYLSGNGYRGLGYLRWRLSILECAAERAAAEAELALQASELIVFNRDPVRHRAVRRIAADARRAADRAREATGELDWSGTLAATTAAQEHALRARAAWRKGD